MEFLTTNTILYCQNWQETVAFYKEKLSLNVTVALDWFVEFELNSASRLSIADTARTSLESCKGEGVTITLEVEDIEEARRKLQSAGLNPPAAREHAWGPLVFYVCDPEGNRIEFWCR